VRTVDTERLRRAVLIIAFSTVFAFIAGADTIVLREEAYVKGPKVLLGDVADIEGENRSTLETVEVASAAQPGDCCQLNATLVISRVRNAGIDPEVLEVKGARSVKATTLHRELAPETILESLHTFIETEMPWDLDATEIDVSMPTGNIVLPEGELEIAWRPSPQYRYVGTGSFRGEIRVDGNFQKNVLCKASVEPFVDIVVARKEISRGKPLSANDVDLEKQRVSALKEGVYHNIEELQGFVAKTTILSGDVITNAKVAPQTIIKRNQMVLVEATIASMVIQTRARANSDACAGDLVFCQNLDSKETFQGIVRSDGVVVVQ